MHQRTRTAIGAAWALGVAVATAPALAITIDFETPAIGAAVAELSGDSFAASGVNFRTVRLSGTVALGATVTLADVSGDMRLYRDASAISGQQLAGPALGGSANDLLMTFAEPLRALSLVSDDMVETPNTIRLLALAETATTGRYRVVDFVEAQDDAAAAPGNLLALAPSESFTLALFEVTRQQEGFDDLSFALASGTPVVVDPPSGPPVPVVSDVGSPTSLALFAGMLGAATAARRAARVAIPANRG